MTTQSGEWKYAQIVGEQYNPNYDTTRTRWKNLSNASGSDNRTWGSCEYVKKGSTYYYPCDLSAHDFQLDIPENAYVKDVTIEMSLKVSSPSLMIEAPWIVFEIYGSNITIPSQTKYGETGWIYGGSDYAVNIKERVSTSEKIFRYTFPESELSKKKFPAREFNQNITGVDIHFKTPFRFTEGNGTIFVNWVRIKVNYEMPYLKFRWGSLMLDPENPYELNLNQVYKLPIMLWNTSKASAGRDRVVDVQIPFGMHVHYYEILDGHSTLEVVDEFEGKYKWHIDCSVGAENVLNLFCKMDTVGFKQVSGTLDNLIANGYVYVHGDKGDYSTAHISSSDVQKHTISCFYFRTKVLSTDSSIAYEIVVDGENQTDNSLISQTFRDFYNNPTGENNYLINWTLSEDSQIQGVSIDEENTDSNHIAFNIPRNTPVEIEWSGCFMIVTEGENSLYLVDGDSDQTYTYEYISYAANNVAAKLLMEDSIWYDHRLLTRLDLEGIVIPFAAKDTDKYMVEGNCNLKMHIQEPIPYIGCIPLSHSHHDPKSDFTNKIIKNDYKNKKYTGKTGEIEESITCNIYLPPRDWTTLQGLCEMDKPVPVNAVLEAFEGDVLNHRGWVELGGVKNVQKTNPLWYKGELDFEYITHNINARFQIVKGVSVTPYTTEILKNFLDYVCESGDEFADYTYTNVDGMIVHNRTGYFNVETDGTYLYDKDSAPNRRTLMTMDNGQRINIKSVDSLSESNKISFEWNSTKIPENRENNIERIIRIVNKDGLILLEYKYYDYDFDTRNDVYSCRVNCVVLNKSIGAFDTVIDTTMSLGNDIESLNLVKDINGHIVQENEPVDIDAMPETDRTYYDNELQETVELSPDPFTYNDFMYGSKLHFTLVGNVLSILDEGFNGKEISYDNITLEKDEYYYEVEFINRNVDGDTNDVLHFFDFEIQETILTTDLKQLYSDIVVSSFPVMHKTLLFTRTAEEGTVYYYKNESSPFTYIQEPFYMYQNGVDLKTINGISLFNLNNSYTIFYLQNGLVRLGFNRINGELYLYKYDVYSKSYVRVANLQLTEYTDFGIGAFSDDKIEVKVGKTIFAMYRGYPYVVIKHDVNDIDFITKFNQVYAEGVNGVNQEFPVMWDLINSDNLLPSCISGDNLKGSCFDVDVVYNDNVGTEPSLSLSKVSPPTVNNGDTIIFEVTGSVQNVDEEISILGTYKGSFGEYTSETLDKHNRKIDNNSPYKTVDQYHRLVVKLHTTIKTTSNIKLDVYEENDDNPITYSNTSTTLDDGSKELTFIVPHENYDPRTVLDKFIVRLQGTYNLFDLNEHISVLVDGEDSYVGKVTSNNPVYDSKGNLVMVTPLSTNKFALIFKDNNPHTIQAVYKGNEEIGVAISNTLMITPVQPSQDQGQSQDDGRYVLTQQIPSEMKYLETPNFRWKLTKGGAPAPNKVIERIVPNAVWTATTNRNGEVMLRFGSDISALYSWTVGTYKIGGQFFHYNEQDPTDKTVVSECWSTLKIIKNTPTLVFIPAGTVGWTTQFKLLDPQGEPMPNRKITIRVGSQTYTKTTDSVGKVYLRINRRGNFKYTATFNGDNNYNAVSLNASETIN